MKQNTIHGKHVRVTKEPEIESQDNAGGSAVTELDESAGSASRDAGSAEAASSVDPCASDADDSAVEEASTGSDVTVAVAHESRDPEITVGITPEDIDQGATVALSSNDRVSGSASGAPLQSADPLANASAFGDAGAPEVGAPSGGGYGAGAPGIGAPGAGTQGADDVSDLATASLTSELRDMGPTLQMSVPPVTPVAYPQVDPSGQPGAYLSADFVLPEKRKHKGRKIAAIVFGVLFIVILAVYLGGAFVFMNWFPPNTTIGSLNISMKSSEEVEKMLDDIAKNYRLNVSGDGFTYSVTGNDIGLTVDSKAIVSAMHSDLSGWTWPQLLMQSSHDESDRFSLSFKRSSYETNLRDAIEDFNEDAEDPVNATIEFDEDSTTFVIVPEKAGTKLNADAVLESMDTAIRALEEKVVLGDKELIQPTVLSTDEKLKESAEMATGMISAHLKFDMDGEDAGEITPEKLSEFITMDDDLGVDLDEEELESWIEDFASGLNTVGTERTYQREDDKYITVSGGSYGWQVDNEALKEEIMDAISEGGETTIDVPCLQTAAVYNGRGSRDWGNRYIDIDLDEQYVRFYDGDGDIIWESACISGKPDGEHDTVPGVWVINDKRSPSKLIGYENGEKIYESDVTYWMPFEGNAIGLHDADWQPSFGGTLYADGYGSHGCVNLPPAAAAELYSMVEVGDVVSCHW